MESQEIDSEVILFSFLILTWHPNSSIRTLHEEFLQKGIIGIGRSKSNSYGKNSRIEILLTHVQHQ